MLIKPEWMDAALEYIATSGEDAAAAKGERILAEHGVKQAKARVFLTYQGSVAEREANAIASPEYAAAVQREARAVKEDEYHRTQRAKYEAVIEAWRTQSANERSGNNFR